MELDVVDINNSKCFSWGDHCNVWNLMDEEALVVMQEDMPPGSSDEMHYHDTATQFVFVLQGELSIEFPSFTKVLKQNQGIKIPQKTAHKIANIANATATFLTISTPGKINDRIISN